MEQKIILHTCGLGYNNNQFSKFCISNEKFEATDLPLLEKLEPLDSIVADSTDPEHAKKFIYKAIKIFAIVKIEKAVYGSEDEIEFGDKAIHGFVDGVDFYDALNETIQSIPHDNRRGYCFESAENYSEITVYQTKDDILKRLWVGQESYHVNGINNDASYIHVMVQTKNDSIFQGIIELRKVLTFLAPVIYPEDKDDE